MVPVRTNQETDTDVNELPLKFSVCVNIGQEKLNTIYWLPKFHKRPYKKVQVGNDQENA